MDRAAVIEELWRRGDLRWLLWPQQLSIYERIKALPVDVTTVVLMIARQYGKSVLGCVNAVEDCLHNPGTVTMIIGPTIKDTRDIVYPRMRLITRTAPKGLIRPVKSDDTYYFSNEAELKISGYDSDVSPRGKTIHKVYLEELTRSDPDKYRDFIRSELTPALTHSVNAKIIYNTTPPPIPDHPFLTETVPEASKNNALFVYTIDDNKQITEKKRQQLIHDSGGINSVEVQREYYCRVVRDPNVLLIPEFDQLKHVQEFGIPPFAPFWVAGDTGGSRDKTCLLLLTFNQQTQQILVVDEVELPNTTTDREIAEAGIRLERNNGIRHKILRFIDCFSQTRVNFSKDFGWFTCLPRCKAQANTIAGVRDVRTAFYRDAILVHPRCKFLIKSLRSSQWNPQRTDFLRTEDLGHADAVAALIYGVRNVQDKELPKPYHLNAENMVNPQPTENRHAFSKIVKGV